LSFRHAFTLVEVLIVVGLIAVLATVVLLTLNPLDFLKQGRDSTRLNDLSNLVRTLNYIQAESPQTFFGNPKTIYISRPDPNLTGDATSNCPNMNLPPIPTDWSYYCVSPQNLSRIDGKGWIPIDFSKQAIFRLSKLPVDPKNDENYYYTYVYDPNTQTFEIDTALESQKQKHLLSEDNGDNNNLYELGTNLTLYPIGGIGQNFALKNESNQFLKNESNYAIYVAQAAGTGQVSFFIAPDQVTGDNNLFWDNTNKRLGIWTTSPASKLSVSGGVSIGSTYAGTAAPVDGLIVQGNVGIGTTEPGAKLHVSGGNLVVSPDSTYIAAYYIKPLYIAKAGTVEMRIHSTDNAGDVGILFQGAGSRGEIYADGNYKLKINSNNAYGTGRVDINPTDTGNVTLAAGGGNVGIGTTGPNSKLQVTGGDVYVSTQGNGIILRDTDGTGCHRITVNSAGTITATAVTCH
jgi:prepilin-type N-terminal cleavage/methylation domain-containing protein